MRKQVLAVSLSLAVVALVGTPATGGAQSSGTDSVMGTARECFPFAQPFPQQDPCERTLVLHVDIESGPGGDNPTGTVTLQDLGVTPGGTTYSETEATCLWIRDNVAVVGVTGTWQRFGATGFVLPIAGLVRIVDAGGTDSGADTFQFALRAGAVDDPPLPGPGSCFTFPGTFPPGGSNFPDFTNETGDVVVADTRHRPASTDECGNGAWRDAGFNSHQQCVIAAEQQARQECVFIRAAHGQPAFRAWYGSGVHKRHAMRRCVHDRSSS